MNWILIALFPLSIAFAQDSNWSEVHSSSEEANTRPQMQELIEKYGFLYQGELIDMDTLSRVIVNRHVYQYNRPSTCDGDDPRLVYRAYGHGWCNIYQGREYCQYRNPIAPNDNSDPCVETR